MNQAPVYDHTVTENHSASRGSDEEEGEFKMAYAKNQKQNQHDPEAVPSASGCCGIFCHELRTGWFDEVATNGRTIDLDVSFRIAPMSSNWFIKIAKAFFLGIFVSALIAGVILHPTPDFYLAYLTHWSLIVSIIYQALSVMLSVLSFSNTPRCMVRATWILFTVSINVEVLVAFLFWFLEYGPNYKLKYTTFVTHGVVPILLALDGLVLNRTPVRLSHWFLSFLFMILYSIWTLLQQFVLEYNPGDDDDDDAIYDALAWRKNAGKAAILLAAVILVASPIVHLVVWSASLCGRKYCSMPSKGVDASGALTSMDC